MGREGSWARRRTRRRQGNRYRRDREADVGPWSPCSGPGGWFPQQETTFLIKRWLHLLFGRTNLLDYGR